MHERKSNSLNVSIRNGSAFADCRFHGDRLIRRTLPPEILSPPSEPKKEYIPKSAKVNGENKVQNHKLSNLESSTF